MPCILVGCYQVSGELAACFLLSKLIHWRRRRQITPKHPYLSSRLQDVIFHNLNVTHSLHLHIHCRAEYWDISSRNVGIFLPFYMALYVRRLSSDLHYIVWNIPSKSGALREFLLHLSILSILYRVKDNALCACHVCPSVTAQGAAHETSSIMLGKTARVMIQKM